MDQINVFVVNAQSPCLDRALAFSKHYIKSKEWSAYELYAYQLDIKKIRKYIPRWGEDVRGAIFKEDVDW